METLEQRNARIAELEAARAARRASTQDSEPDHPVEIAPGRGDLRNRSISVPVGPIASLPMPLLPGNASSVFTVDGRQISFARIFAEQPWVAAAIMRMLTWSVRVPLKVYRRTGDDSRIRLRPEDHPLAAAIDKPWEGGYQAALTMAMLGPLLVHGNSVTSVQEGRSGAIQFNPIDWRYLMPIRPFPDTIAGWSVAANLNGNNTKTSLSADEALHVKWWSPLGPEGVSPLQQLGTTVSIEDAAMRFMRQQLRNGARPPSAITASAEFLGLDKDVRDALLAQLREDVTQLYAGPENAGRPAVLPPGLEWNAVGHTAVEAELIDQRHLDREEVAAVYQIPPPMLGDLRRATFSNIVELRQVAYGDGLGPPLVLIEQVMTALVLRHLLRETDTYVEYDFSGVLRGDALKEINTLRAGVGMGLFTPNEGRSRLNLPSSPEPDADKLWMPFNNIWPMGTQPPRPKGVGGNSNAEAGGLIVAENWHTVVARERAALAKAQGDTPGARTLEREGVLA